MTRERIGFVGLGAMGKLMASNLIKKGFPLIVYDVRKEPLQQLSKLGAETASSSQEVGRKAKIIIVVTRTFPQVKEVFLGKEGILKSAEKDSIIVIMSTISPPEVKEVAEACKMRGIKVIDAPISGGTKGAAGGTLTIMVGGDKSTFESCLPLFEAMGKNIYHMGNIGMGQTVKLVNQLLVSVNLLAVAEGVVLGVKAGIDPQKLFEVLGKGAAESWVLNYVSPRIVSRDFTNNKSTLYTLIKDSEIVASTGIKLKVPLPIASAAYQVYVEAEACGLGEEDISGVVRLFEKFAKVE